MKQTLVKQWYGLDDVSDHADFVPLKIKKAAEEYVKTMRRQHEKEPKRNGMSHHFEICK